MLILLGNFFINLTSSDENVLLPLVMLDSNMYGEGGWFYSGFDRIHDDQVEWCKFPTPVSSFLPSVNMQYFPFL